MTAQNNSSSFGYTHDPYETYLQDQSKSKNLIHNDRSTKFARKYQRFKQSLSVKKTYFLYGGLQGFAIGCLAGFGIGLISAYQARRFILIPLSMLGSGIFFSGVMAFGSLIRSADKEWMESRNEELDEKIDGKQGFMYVMEINESLKKERLI